MDITLGGRIVTPTTPPSSDERTWMIIAHLSAVVAGLFGLAPLGPLVVWLIKKESRLVTKCALEALAFSIGAFVIVLAYIALSVALMCVGIGFILIFLAPILGLAFLAYLVIAAIHASENKVYEYPLTSQFVKVEV